MKNALYVRLIEGEKCVTTRNVSWASRVVWAEYFLQPSPVGEWITEDAFKISSAAWQNRSFCSNGSTQ